MASPPSGWEVWGDGWFLGWLGRYGCGFSRVFDDKLADECINESESYKEGMILCIWFYWVLVILKI